MTPRTIVVVGATSGIGRAVALQLADTGHRVLAVGRDHKRADDLRRRLSQDSPDSHIIVGDVSTRLY